MLRKKLIYKPEFEGAIEKYVHSFLRTHAWKIKTSMEKDDMLQESYLVFRRLELKYTDMDTAEHFMALFKTAWFNHFVDLAHADSKIRKSTLECDIGVNSEGEEITLDNIITGELNNDGMIKVMIQQAPEEVKQVLGLFLNAPSELLELASETWKKQGHNNDYGNKMLCKLLGIKENKDLISTVRNYFLS